MNRVTTAASVLTVSAITFALTACGNGSGSQYCDQLEGANAQFSAGGAMADQAAIADAADTFQRIADSAPEEVKQDWHAFADAFTTLAGLEVDPTDPEAMSDPQVADQLQGLQADMTQTQDIETHAQEECDLDLSAGTQN
ncbi:hypothetical protein CLV30_12229 [Haloactinopolyspora alba]|uniref:Small secreted protein n=1 Tax=Haloactinopolyspora alba TaxID=648780 RepID=A0A2P8DJY8_9ACTN|nr:hypothetical protein [Haloactinopolyspora alba]PSK97537.1 hypothetical protein CLV30_12229 [Haloactinopolyspora alba]